MKKTKVFFMTLLVAITLFGFSGTSLAFNLSDITGKPAQFVRYVAKWLGFGDKEDKKSAQTEPASKVLPIKENDETAYNSENKPEPADLYSRNINATPGFNNKYVYSSNKGLNQAYFLYGRQNFNLAGDDWHFSIGSETGKIIIPFRFRRNSSWHAFDSLTAPVWLTRMEYQTGLPWRSLPSLDVGFSFISAFNRQGPVGLDWQNPYDLNDALSLHQGDFSYGLSVNAPFKGVTVGLYEWYGEQSNPLSPAFSSPYEMMDYDYYTGNNNLAATVSYQLPFMGFLHDGLSPTIRLVTAYRFGANRSGYGIAFDSYDQWKVGMSYEGTNRINLADSSFGINWGVGYNYTAILNDPNLLDNPGGTYDLYSGNINASTFWDNFKINTMFMYLYGRDSRGSMTVLGATYSPDWRWSYGIRANFYYGKKGTDYKSLINSELVTFTATYRWD